MAAKITVEKISANEIRVTLTAEIRISGDLSTLTRREDGGIAVDYASEETPGGAPGQELLTVEQTAKILHISRDRVYYLIRSRQLRSIKIGKLRRIPRAWVADFVGQQETSPRPA